VFEEFGRFDFGLTDEQEQRAARLHKESLIVDLLYWGPLGYRSFTPDEEKEDIAAFEAGGIPEMSTSGERRELEFAIKRSDEYRNLWEASGVTAGPRDVTPAEGMAAIAAHQTAIVDHNPWLVKARTAADFRRAKAEGKRAIFINSQQTGQLQLEHLDVGYNFGLRMLMLTYNVMNHLCAGCTERTDAGVSNVGVQVIKRMDELGIIVDTSHLGKQSTLDCCTISKKPVVASHTAAQEVYFHDRGKSDDELKALARTGGVIGVVTVPFFLGEGQGTVSIEAMLDHIDYIAALVGWKHVAIGTDWPLGFTTFWLSKYFHLDNLRSLGFREEHDVQPTTNLVGFDDYRDFPNITRGLVKRGYDDEQINGILGENFLRVFENVCG
jgi:membrane dipeptidase